MTMEILKSFFFWCSVINLVLFIFSFLAIIFLRKFIVKTQGMWYKIEEDRLYSILYNTMIIYKILIIVFNIVPYIALRIISG